MDDVARMRGLQTLGHAAADGQQRIHGHRTLLHLAVEARPLDIIHDQVDMAVLCPVAFGIAHYRVVTDVPHLLLAREQQEIVVIARQLLLQHLERHQPARDLGPRAVDVGGPATAQQDLDPVGVVEKLARLERVAGPGVNHGGRSAGLCAAKQPVDSAQGLELDPAVGVGARIVRIEGHGLAHADGLKAAFGNAAIAL